MLKIVTPDPVGASANVLAELTDSALDEKIKRAESSDRKRARGLRPRERGSRKNARKAPLWRHGNLANL